MGLQGRIVGCHRLDSVDHCNRHQYGATRAKYGNLYIFPERLAGIYCMMYQKPATWVGDLAFLGCGCGWDSIAEHDFNKFYTIE